MWAVNLATLPPARSYAVRIARVCHTLVREFIDGELNQRAASLVFTTLLSLVPLLAVSFSVLKAFGVADKQRMADSGANTEPPVVWVHLMP